MHLIHSVEVQRLTPFYQKHRRLSSPNSLPYIFRRLRIHRCLTKKALAKKFGFTEEYITSIENGSKYPSLRYCLMCGEEFGANPNWVKVKWFKGAIDRYKNRLTRRLGLED